MAFAAVFQPGVVEGRCGVNHVRVDVIVAAEVQGAGDHCPGVVLPVSGVKVAVAGNNLAFNIVP